MLYYQIIREIPSENKFHSTRLIETQILFNVNLLESEPIFTVPPNQIFPPISPPKDDGFTYSFL